MDEKKHFDQHIFVCINERKPDHPSGCCLSKGSEHILNELKTRAKQLNLNKNIRVNKAGCLGRCAEGIAVVIYPDNQWFLNVQEKDIDTILDVLKKEVTQ